MSELMFLVLSMMISLQPPDATVPWAGDYMQVAEVLADAAEQNPLPSGPESTAALLTVWAYHESRFNPEAIGDSGHSLGLLQVAPTTADALHPPTREELSEPRANAMTALSLFHLSFKICHRMPLEERLAQYAYGRDCSHRAALSRSRMREARALLAHFVP